MTDHIPQNLSEQRRLETIVRKASHDRQQQSSKREDDKNDRKVRIIHTEEIPEDVYPGEKEQPGD